MIYLLHLSGFKVTFESHQINRLKFLPWLFLCKESNHFYHYNFFCIPESFNTNISHQLFDYKITLLNSQHENMNSKGDFVLKNWHSLNEIWVKNIYCIPITFSNLIIKPFLDKKYPFTIQILNLSKTELLGLKK